MHIYFLLIVFFYLILYTLFLTKFPLVYIDEMYHLDSAWQFAKHDKLALSVYGDLFNLDKHLLYQPPVFNLMLGLWFKFGLWTKLFGLSVFQGRLFTVFISLFSVIFTYLLAKELYNERIALLAMFILIINPRFFAASRFVRYDMAVVTFTLMGIYFYLKGKERRYFYFISGLSIVLSFLSHMYGFFGIISIIALFFYDYGFKFIRKKDFLLFALGVIIPLLFYFYWISLDFENYLKQLSIVEERLALWSLDFYIYNITHEIDRWTWQWEAMVAILVPWIISLIYSLKNLKQNKVVVSTLFIFLICFTLLIHNKIPKYAMVMYPFFSILLAVFLYENSPFITQLSQKNMNNLRKSIPILMVIGLLIIQPISIAYILIKYSDADYEEYTSRIAEFIPKDAVIMAQYGLWPKFHDQKFYAEWMIKGVRLYGDNETKNRLGTTFAEAVIKNSVDYVIVDGTLLFYQNDPGIPLFLKKNCKLVGIVKDRYYSGKPGEISEEAETKIYRVVK